MYSYVPRLSLHRTSCCPPSRMSRTRISPSSLVASLLLHLLPPSLITPLSPFLLLRRLCCRTCSSLTMPPLLLRSLLSCQAAASLAVLEPLLLCQRLSHCASSLIASLPLHSLPLSLRLSYCVATSSLVVPLSL